MINRVSIIIACYNDPDVVVAVKSAYSQSYSNKEIIVVDDGSSKETKDALGTVAHFIDMLITQENKGQSNARNNGIGKATGEYILNLDSDDYFEESFCEKAVRIFEKDSAVKIVTCKARRFSKNGTIDVFIPKGGDLTNFLFANSALGSAMFKKKDWEESVGYEETLPILGFEDWEFYIQLLKNEGYAYVIDEVLFNYQIRAGSTTQRIRNKKDEKFKQIILKHRELYQEHFDDTINHLFSRMENMQQERIRIKESADYKTGKRLLRPFRYLKRKF